MASNVYTYSDDPKMHDSMTYHENTAILNMIWSVGKIGQRTDFTNFITTNASYVYHKFQNM